MLLEGSVQDRQPSKSVPGSCCLFVSAVSLKLPSHDKKCGFNTRLKAEHITPHEAVKRAPVLTAATGFRYHLSTLSANMAPLKKRGRDDMCGHDGALAEQQSLPFPPPCRRSGLDTLELDDSDANEPLPEDMAGQEKTFTFIIHNRVGLVCVRKQVLLSYVWKL